LKILITGPEKCGKSEFAEEKAVSFKLPAYYIATMKPYGEHGQIRIKKHRLQRQGKGFITIEKQIDLDEIVIPYFESTVLLECISNLVANEIFDNKKSPERILQDILDLSEKSRNFIAVTTVFKTDNCNEETINYIETINFISNKFAEKCDKIYDCTLDNNIIRDVLTNPDA
jgi:adenosylcobinamide kinase/adenosylcobinamide-phosphate guanylyltransferase